ncbi:hypothetical protein PR048_032763 [Dryococelus australis]|uniref:Uncharacterized protein n=1 Tax=Dryococelus australis TaxID=614101 RepID=A0ABQ9G335_9NEOP|nr:hypothetical protein PR048_032763 [Dryococelus australis]
MAVAEHPVYLLATLNPSLVKHCYVRNCSCIHNDLEKLPRPLVHTVFDTSWGTVAQLSPSIVTADNQCAVDIGILVHKTVGSSLQVTELANFSAAHSRTGPDFMLGQPFLLAARPLITSLNPLTQPTPPSFLLAQPFRSSSDPTSPTPYTPTGAKIVLLKTSHGAGLEEGRVFRGGLLGRAGVRYRFLHRVSAISPLPPPPSRSTRARGIVSWLASFTLDPLPLLRLCPNSPEVHTFAYLTPEVTADEGEARYGAAPECKGEGNWSYPRKPADQRIVRNDSQMRKYLPDFHVRESSRTMPLVDGFSRASPVSPALAFRRRSIPHLGSLKNSSSGHREIRHYYDTQNRIWAYDSDLVRMIVKEVLPRVVVNSFPVQGQEPYTILFWGLIGIRLGCTSLSGVKRIRIQSETVSSPLENEFQEPIITEEESLERLAPQPERVLFATLRGKKRGNFEGKMVDFVGKTGHFDEVTATGRPE